MSVRCTGKRSTGRALSNWNSKGTRSSGTSTYRHQRWSVLPETAFPEGFLWGAATAAHQVEGGNRLNDWWEFEQRPGRIHGGDSSEVACEHYLRYREDFQQLAALHHNAHRLSLEWSRIEPEQGQFAVAEIAHYRDVLTCLRELGMEPMVTLHHFTSPSWFARRGGFEARDSAAAFIPFVNRVLDELGDLVNLWCTINEPNIYAVHGWLLDEFPPGRRGDLVSAYRVLANLRRAHELAYQAIKLRRPDSAVGLAQNKWILEPARPAAARDRLAAGAARLAVDYWPRGRFRLQRVVEASADFIGLNHYAGSLCRFDLRRPKEQFIHRFNPPGVDLTDMGWPVRPSWMRRCLLELEPLRKPVYITENGIATEHDAVRRRFLVDVLSEVAQAIAAGVDVRGYFHWTAWDNFEWAKGYAPRFGIIGRDRKPKPSAELYARIAAANGAFQPSG